MLKIVNSELFTVRNVVKEATEEYPSFVINEFYPSGLLKIDMNRRPDFKVFPVAKLFRYSENGKLMMKFRNDERTGKTQCQMQLNDRAKHDNNVFLMAIPFNGIMQPVDNGKYIRIHSAVVFHSDEPFTIDEVSYSNVAYLLVSLDYSRMTADEVNEVTMTFASKVRRQVEGEKRKAWFNNITEVFLNIDGSHACAPMFEDPDPDFDYTPDKENKVQAFRLFVYRPKQPKPEATEKSFLSAAPADAVSMDDWE